MAEENKVEPIVEPKVEPEVEPTPKPEETKIDPKEMKNQVLRELSKDLGVNVFEAEGLAKVKELIDSQKTEQEKLQEKLQAYEEEKAQWQSAKLQYESKLKATELGIATDKLEDALKLADNDPEKLPDIVKKYPSFKQSKGQINVGVQDPTNTTPPNNMSEALEYMSKDPRYKNYINQLKK